MLVNIEEGKRGSHQPSHVEHATKLLVLMEREGEDKTDSMRCVCYISGRGIRPCGRLPSGPSAKSCHPVSSAQQSGALDYFFPRPWGGISELHMGEEWQGLLCGLRAQS